MATQNPIELVPRWVAAWVKSRRVPPPDSDGGALRIFVGQQERRFEFITVAPDAAVDDIRPVAESASDLPGRNWVTVITREPKRATEVLRGAGLSVDGDTEWLMTIDLADQRVLGVPDPYRLEVRNEGDVAAVTVSGLGGAIAATGRIGFDGVDAVPDKIVTGLDHRRKGLGAAVMGALVTEAVRRGTRTGILAASVEGERLYTSLGWSPIARLVVGRTE